jgi:serine/threonine-protein kinase 24/25/MST4
MCFQLVEQLRRRTRKTNADEVEFIRELGRLATQTNPAKRPTARQCLVMCMSWLRGGDDVITPDIYPGRDTLREKYWVHDPMDGGTWKHDAEPSKSPSDSDSEDEPLSPSERIVVDGDEFAHNNRSVDAQRGTKRDEREGSDTPVSAPPINSAKRVNSTSTDLHVRGELEAVRLNANGVK